MVCRTRAWWHRQEDIAFLVSRTRAGWWILRAGPGLVWEVVSWCLGRLEVTRVTSVKSVEVNNRKLGGRVAARLGRGRVASVWWVE